MSWRFVAIEHDQPRSCSSLQCTLRRTVACPLYNSIQTTLRLVAVYMATYYKNMYVSLSSFSYILYPTYDETCPFIRSFHSSTLWSTEYSSNAECLYSPSLPCSNPTSLGRVWAPQHLEGAGLEAEVGAMRDRNFSFPWMSELPSPLP
jgi:hypothetical protein